MSSAHTHDGEDSDEDEDEDGEDGENSSLESSGEDGEDGLDESKWDTDSGEDGEDGEDDSDEEEESDDEVEEKVQTMSRVEVLFEGDGENRPNPGDICRCHYKCILPGEASKPDVVLESSRARKRAFEFVLGTGEVVAALDECVGNMTIGEHIVIHAPPEAAYGTKGWPPKIPPNQPLKFDIELIEIKQQPAESAFDLRIDEEESSVSSESGFSSEGFSDGEDWGGEDGFSGGEDEG